MILTCSFLMPNDEECGERCEGNTPFCGSHNRFLRKEKELAEKALAKKASLLSKPKKVYAKPNKVSDKRKELNKEYSMLRPQYLLDHPECEVKLIGCGLTSIEIHHTYSGSNKVKHLNDVSTWKATCGHCHKILHDKLSAKEARELGLKI